MGAVSYSPSIRALILYRRRRFINHLLTYLLTYFVTMSLSCIICEIKRDYRSKIVIFSYPLAFDAPVRGVPVGVLCVYFGVM